MASNHKTSQQKRTKTTNNCFLACFGIHPKTTNNIINTSSYKKRPKKFCARKKFFFKLSWPKKFKVISIDNNNNNSSSKIKKNFKFDANKTAVLKASHNIILEATKVHHQQQFKVVDHHVSKSITTKETILLPRGSTHDQDNQSRSPYRATCHVKDNDTSKAVVKQQPLFAEKVTKDSLIGALIMVAMLLIMSIWGRLCAILCMCGWLYCVPFLRGDKEVFASSNDKNMKWDVDKEVMASSNDTNMKVDVNKEVMASSNNKYTKIDVVDYNSELYKKRVVLDGLLQRDYYQNAVGIS